MKYPWSAKSPSDPTGNGLGYTDQDEAEYHCRCMNALIEEYDENPRNLWNKDHWKTKPEPWVVTKNE